MWHIIAEINEHSHILRYGSARFGGTSGALPTEEDGEYIGLCAEFPSLSWLASEPETALQGIRQVVAEVVADLQASGEGVPEPLALRKYSGRFMVRVPPELHRRLAMEALESGVSLNRLAADKLSRTHS